MKTKEFMKAIDDLGFTIKIAGCWMIIITLNDVRLLKINSLNQSVVFFRGTYNCQLHRKLLTLVTLYINTPSEEREEEKRYYLQLIAIVEALEQHYKTADGYVKQLESKRIKLPRDRKAIRYWEGQRNAFDRAIYLTTLYEVTE